MPKNWIANAIKRPGSFRKSAQKAGKSTHAFAEEHKGEALTLMGMHHKK